MPFILVAAFSDLAWAALTLLLAIAVWALTRAIAGTFPSIPVIGNVIASSFTALGDYCAQFIVNASHTWWDRIANLIRADRWILNTMMTSVLAVLGLHADQVAQLNNTTIPEAASTAQTNAFNHADSLATSLQDNINNLTDTEANDVAGLHSSIESLNNYINGPFIGDINNAINSAQAGAVTQADNDINNAVSTLVDRIGADETLLNQLDVLATSAVPAEIAAALCTSEAYATNAVNAATVALQDQIGAAETALQAAITAGDNVLAGQIVGSIDQLNTQLDTIVGRQQIDELNIGAIGNLATIAIPAAIAAVAVNVATLTSEYDSCAVTTCAGPNNISSLLNELLGVGGEVSLLSFIAAAVKDPAGEAAAFAPEVGGLFSAGQSLFDGLLSL